MFIPAASVIIASNNANASRDADPLVTYIVVGLTIVCLLILLYGIGESYYLEYKQKKQNEKNKAEGKMHY